MTDHTPTRRDIMKPAQLLGLAFAAAIFSGIVTLVVMGAFQSRAGTDIPRAIVVALTVAGIAFIATLLIIALLMLMIDPAEVTKVVDRPVLFDKIEPGDEQGDATGNTEQDHPAPPSGPTIH